MDFFQCQDTFRQMYPGKNISYEFDENCHRIYEIVLTDNIPNPFHHCESHKVKVMVEGMNPIYVPIQPHREVFTWEYMKNLINKKSDPVK